MRAPSSFGEAAVFGPGVFPATCEVLEDGRVARIPRGDLLDLLRRRPEVSLAMLASLSVWLRRLLDLVDSLALATVEQRVAGYLWALFSRASPAPQLGLTVHLDEPKHVIAAVTLHDPAGLATLARRE